MVVEVAVVVEEVGVQILLLVGVVEEEVEEEVVVAKVILRLLRAEVAVVVEEVKWAKVLMEPKEVLCLAVVRLSQLGLLLLPP